MGDSISSRVDSVLSSLPPDYLVAGQDDARFVVGACGAFVLLPALPATVAAGAGRLRQLSLSTRLALCDHLAWIPFVDALLVTAGDPPRGADVTMAPLDLLHTVLTRGPEVVDPATIAAIRHAVRTASLDGWMVGSASAGAKIDLCDPAQPTTSTR